MKNTARLLICLGLIACSTFSLAQPGHGPGRGVGMLDNDDLQWIFQWQRDQQITELAGALALSVEQVNILVDVKAEVEAIEVDMQPALDALTADTETLAATVRANIEQTGAFSEADQEALQGMHHAYRTLQREKKLRFDLATMPLENLLTDEQKTIWLELAQTRRGERQRGRGHHAEGNSLGQGQQADNGQGRGRGWGREGRVGDRVKQHAVRTLLSDTFIGFYTN